MMEKGRASPAVRCCAMSICAVRFRPSPKLWPNRRIVSGHRIQLSIVKSKAQILEEFALFSVPGAGIGGWLTETWSQRYGGAWDMRPSLPHVQKTVLVM